MYLQRIEKVKTKMEENAVDALILSPSSNLFYLTGYNIAPDERLFLFALPKTGEPFLLANLLYKEQAKALPVEAQIFWKDGDDPFNLLKTEIEKRKIKMDKAAIEPNLPAFFLLPLKKLFPKTDFTLGSFLIEPLRLIKERDELDLIAQACVKSDEALSCVIGKGIYWIGKTEKDFLFCLQNELNIRGIDSFGASIQAGANSAIPHYSTGISVIKKGSCLLVDFWGSYKGYFTDCTRTFHFGEPPEEFKKAYNIVLEAHLASEEKAKTGNTLGEVDYAARCIIEKYGYAEYFTHRTGHGLGIDAHEGVCVNKGEETIIEQGMVFSIEPGIYLPGRFGVRIENTVAVGLEGAQALHKFRRDLMVID